eukprot:gene38813-47202_t
MEDIKENLVSSGMHIAVEDLLYSVKQAGKGKSKKVILHGLSFQLTPGALCALMGPSGSGKSTLLDLLADRKTDGFWSGRITFNGGERSRWFRRDSAYILQDDLHIPTLTVRETIHFAASTRLPESSGKALIEERVSLLLRLMGLEHVQHSTVGGGGLRGISGGQLKRLSIAVEIVALPDVIFLDEPTSGLDSLIALEVMQVVRRLADQRRTCVSTIHQPSPQVFELFDLVLLIAAGRMVYFGPSTQVLAYFTGLGFPFAKGDQVAEFMLEVSQGVRESRKSGKISVLELERRYAQSDVAAECRKVTFVEQIGGAVVAGSQAERLHATTKVTQLVQLLR